MMKKLAVLCAVVLMGASPLSAATALDKDTLIAATEATYPPYESRNSKNEMIGFDIDLVNIIGEKLGKKIEWVDMAFDSLIPALMTGKVDLVAAGMSATEERAKRVNFSAPYEISFSAFVTSAENPPKNTDELAGKSVAVQIGTVQESFARSLGNVEVKTFQKFDDCVREVMLGRAAATLMDIPVAKKFVAAKDFAGKVTVAFEKQITGADKAVAMPKNDTQLTEAVSKIIDDMNKNGEMEALRKKWFEE
ncbi:MAG: transporter substrate-binding domain-containing protein [Pyramidobacter sp.]|jgi:ABC-type amino acid transport substrate-binding protein